MASERRGSKPASRHSTTDSGQPAPQTTGGQNAGSGWDDFLSGKEDVKDSIGPATPEAGVTSLTQSAVDPKSSMESEILAHVELERIAGAIATRIDQAGIRRLLLHDEQDVAALSAFQAFLVRSSWLTEQYRPQRRPLEAKTARAAKDESEAKAADLFSITGATAALGLAEGLVKFIRPDVQITSQEVSIDSMALLAQILAKLRRTGSAVEIFATRLFPPGAASRASQGEVWEALRKLSEVRESARAAVNSESEKANLAALDGELAAFRTDLFEQDKQTGATLLSTLLHAQGLRQILGPKDGVLYLRILKAGGSTRVTKSLKTLFTGLRLHHTGAAITTYLVFDRNGAIKSSGTFYGHSGYVELATAPPQPTSATTPCSPRITNVEEARNISSASVSLLRTAALGEPRVNERGQTAMSPSNNELSPDELRRRAAFAIMCFRFGLDCRNNPPNPDDRVPVNLSTDLARSVERRALTAAATAFLQNHPNLPLVWNPTAHLDLFKDLTFKKYVALCWLQLEVRSLGADVRMALRRAGMEEERAVAAAARTADTPPNLDTPEGAMQVLVVASGAATEDFGGLVDLEG